MRLKYWHKCDVKCICMRLKNWHKSKVHRAFPSLRRIHINFIFYDIALILCLSLRKITLIHQPFYFVLNNKIIQRGIKGTSVSSTNSNNTMEVNKR
jgi:hypothetical protein